jgi:pyrroloquinoline quinone biosynthesis protein E
VTLLTNAIRIDDALAALLGEIGALVLCSLHGPDAACHERLAGAGSFAPARDGIRRLAAHLPAERLVVNTTLHDGNLDRLDEMVDVAARLGAGRIRFMPLHGFAAGDPGGLALTGDGEALLAWARHAAARRVGRSWPIEVGVGLTGIPGASCEDGEGGPVCTIGRQLVVAADGGVYPCAVLMQSEHRLGGAGDGLAAIGRSARLAELAGAVAARRSAVAACAGCALSGICQAGCPALARGVCGSFAAPDPMCAAHQAYGAVFFASCARAR